MVNAVGIRLGTTGKGEVKSDFAEIRNAGAGAMKSIADGAKLAGDAGEREARRLSAAYDRATSDIEAADRRRAAAAAKLATVSVQTPMQARIGSAVGTGFGDPTGTAKQSAIFFAQMAVEQERLEQRTHALRAALDPAYAAQARFNSEMAEARDLVSRGAITLDIYCDKLRQERSLLDASSAARSRATAISGANRAGMQQLSFQLNDVAVQAAAGTPPMIIFAQQSGQVIQALQMMETSGSKVLSFLGGPWGLALTSAAVVAAPFVAKLFEGNNALKEGVDQLRKDAAETDNAARAKAAFAKTIEGLTQAIRAQNEELKRSIQTERDVVIAGAAAARERRSQIEDRIQDTLRELSAAQDAVLTARDLARVSSEDPSAAVAQIASAEMKVDRLRKQLEDLRKTTGEADEAIRRADASIAGFYAKAVNDPLERINQQYDQLKTNAINAAVAQEKSNAALTRELTILEAQRKVALEKAQAAERAGSRSDARAMVQFGSPVAGGDTSGRFGENRPGHSHGGVDIAVPVGTIVRAVADGIVKFAGQRGNYGNVVYVDAGGPEIRDAHLSRIAVEAGQRVSKGDIIGYSGGARGAPGAGNSGGPHVHHEVRVGGRPVNPYGTYGVDPGRTEDRAAEIAARQERDREQAVRRSAQFAGMSADLDRAVLDAKRDGVTDAAALAQMAKEQVAVERDKYVVALDAKVALGDLTKAQRDELATKNALVADLKIQKIDTEEARRRAEDALSAQIAANDNQRDILSAQAGLADTASERLPIALRLLVLDKEEERLRLQAIVDRAKVGQATAAEAKIAQDRLDSLDQRYDARGAKTRRENETPMQAYLREIDLTGAQMNERLDGIKADGLRSFTDGLTEAIVEFRDLGDVAKTVLAQIAADLIRIQVQKGIASLLGNVLGGTKIGGNTAGLEANFDKVFQRNASGTEYFSGGMTWLAENGPELVQLPRGAKISNAANTRRMLANDNAPRLVQQTFDLRGAVVTEDLFRQMQEMARSEVKAAAPSIADMGMQRMLDANARSHGRLMG